MAAPHPNPLPAFPASRGGEKGFASGSTAARGQKTYLSLVPPKRPVDTYKGKQRVGIQQVDDAIWLVSFMTDDLGYIDLEQRTLQPLDNPFGTRLLPMS